MASRSRGRRLEVLGQEVDSQVGIAAERGVEDGLGLIAEVRPSGMGGQVGLARHITLGDRLAKCKPLQLAAHPREVVKMLDRERPDPVPALRSGSDELLAGDTGSRFSHDAQADAVSSASFCPSIVPAG
jgi:hypothetical protein